MGDMEGKYTPENIGQEDHVQEKNGAHFKSGAKVNNPGFVISRFKMWIRRECDPRKHSNMRHENVVASDVSTNISSTATNVSKTDSTMQNSSVSELSSLPAIDTSLPIHETSRLANERLAELRRQKVGEQNVVTVASSDVPIAKEDEEIRSDLVTVTDTQALTVSNETGSLEDMQEEKGLEEEGSPIHPDIEEGARKQIEENLIKAVKNGSTAGISIAIHNYKSAFEQAAKAAQSQFELTPEGQQVLPDRLKRILEEYLPEGIQSIVDLAIFRASDGRDNAFSNTETSLSEFLKLASDYGINILYVPPIESGETTLPVEILHTPDQILDFVEGRMINELPKGLSQILDSFRYKVSKGRLDTAVIEENNQRVEHWLEVMKEHGWEIADHATPYPIQGERTPNIVVREVNRAEIRAIQEQLIKDNLAKGIDDLLQQTAWRFENGNSDPLRGVDNIRKYTEMAQRYGLTHSGGITTETSDVNPGDYIDPALIPQRVAEIVKNNLSAGLDAIIAAHLRYVQKGEGRLVKFEEGVLDVYEKIAQQYGITMVKEEILNRMRRDINPQNLQQGINVVLGNLQEAIRDGNYLAVSGSVTRAEDLKRFIGEVGLTGQVDFSQLEKYMQETATEPRRLTE